MLVLSQACKKGWMVKKASQGWAWAAERSGQPSHLRFWPNAYVEVRGHALPCFSSYLSGTAWLTDRI